MDLARRFPFATAEPVAGPFESGTEVEWSEGFLCLACRSRRFVVRGDG